MVNDQLHLLNGCVNDCEGHMPLRLWSIKEHYMYGSNGVLKDMAGLTNSWLGWCIKDHSCH